MVEPPLHARTMLNLLRKLYREEYVTGERQSLSEFASMMTLEQRRWIFDQLQPDERFVLDTKEQNG